MRNKEPKVQLSVRIPVALRIRIDKFIGAHAGYPRLTVEQLVCGSLSKTFDDAEAETLSKMKRTVRGPQIELPATKRAAR